MTSRITFILTIACLFIYGCSSFEVTRIDHKQNVDLSGLWNDTDSRIVADDLIKQITKGHWLSRFGKTNRKKPVIVFGRFINTGHEHIAVGTFLKDLERSMVESGDIVVIASQLERNTVRKEKSDYEKHNQKIWGDKIMVETEADFMLTGSINTLIDQVPDKKMIFYQIDMELIEIKNQEKVWIGQKKIKKFIKKPRVAW
jgi:penicillin-binding protein activator